jgi:hypothetical protein
MSYVLVDGTNREEETYLKADWKENLDDPYCLEASRALQFETFEEAMKHKSPREKVLNLS